MTDFNTLVNSDNIEDKLKAVQDPICPNEVITEILNHETIDWASNSAISLITEIVSHPNTDVVALMSIFSKYSSKVLSKLTEEESLNQRKLIMQNPNWKLDEITSILSDKIEKTDDSDEKCFMVGSIADVDILDEESEKNIYDKLSKKVNSVYCLCEWVRIVMQMGDRKLAETLLHQAIEIADNEEHWNFIFDTEFEFLRDSDNLKKVLEEKLKPAGFGRYADPDTGEVIAKMQDGKLVVVEKG